MNPALLSRLDSIESRQADLQSELSDPGVLSDQARFRELSKAYADLSGTVEASRLYRTSLEDLETARQMAEGDDPDMASLGREEVARLEPEIEAMELRIKLLLLPPDPHDTKNVIVEIRAGTGGEEAGLFAADLFRMYARYSERRGWKAEILDSSETGLGGYKEVIINLSGERVFSRLKHEGGVHRVQRVPTTEAQGRIHTSAVTVAVLPEAEEVDIRIEEKDLRIDRFCSSGPGGQSVNTTYSAIRITHLPSGLVVSCQDEKSQIKNKAKALKVLRSRLLKMEQDKREAELSTTRKAMVGSGDRSEKVRTYNFPQNRLTDHRINLTLHRLSDILNGDMDILLDPLLDTFASQALDQEFSQPV
jgi:peptide chain release factor 1